ncbi:hypothetical protein WAB17_12330 [Parerythrobacter aurantius]|uniref:hypothetical protein n=1 Tax=Parerythrobacter aurantius TaxID=3127706 RepID=UPI00324A1530
MTKIPLTLREKRVRRHNWATGIALLSLTAFGVLAAAQVGGGFRGFALVLLFPSVVIMFLTRDADEYIAAIWQYGTSVAFVVTVGAMLFVPAIEGFLDGLFEGFTERPTEQDIDIIGLTPVIGVASFFLASAWARIRGTA